MSILRCTRCGGPVRIAGGAIQRYDCDTCGVEGVSVRAIRQTVMDAEDVRPAPVESTDPDQMRIL